MIFIDPSPSINVRTLDFLAKELERDIKFTSIVDTIFQASVAISSNLNLNPLLNKVMSLSVEILNPEVTAVMLLNSKGEELYCEVSRGEKSEFFQEKIILPLGEGIGGYVAQTGESVLLNGVQKYSRWSRSYDKKSGFSTRSMICVPVKFHGKILDVIEVINKKTREFTSRDLRALEILGNACAVTHLAVVGTLRPSQNVPFRGLRLSGRFLRWTQFLIIKILNVFLRLKILSALNYAKIEHFSKVSQQDSGNKEILDNHFCIDFMKGT